TRVQCLFAIPPLALLAAWRGKWLRSEAYGFLVAFMVFAVPYLAQVKRSTGSFLGHLNEHVGFYAAQEKPAGKKPAGSNPPTVTDYLFRSRSPSQFIAGTFKGYGRILFDPGDPYNRIFLNSHYARPWNRWLLPFFWLGLAACLLRRAYRWFLWLPF